MNTSLALEIKSVSKHFGQTHVLKNVSLDIQPGEFLSLVGASGCGKSTLLRVIAGLERQDSGTVSIGKKSVDVLRPNERNVAMVFQNYALYPHMTVAQNVALPLEMARLSWLQRLPVLGSWIPRQKKLKSTIAQEVADMCQSLQLHDLLKRKPAQLSGGQKQRVALARAMIRHPAVFLMDEPLSNLDAKLRVHLRNELVELHKRLQVTFVYVTHDQSEAMTMSDRIAVMDGGEILQIDTPKTLYDHPNSVKVAEFIGTPKINLFQLTTGDSQSRYWGRTQLPQHGACPGAAWLALRPEHLVIDAPRLSTCDVQSRARVDRLEDHGSEVLVHRKLEGFDHSTFTSRLSSHDMSQVFKAGQSIAVGFHLKSALFFDGQQQRLATP